ncbi:hypothetical protein HIM_07019 [Hirsutella minnesotensis 3608]|uniref:Extracellular membrane protein CFEM domain-containing protein n=1 Tax=Hirsutella minnesotensis 3608 TaxID=1043627 RepID=A0A0F7ZIG8_9HYPO|nr:hypothetical protein HIM_07019 [Hirsutella minnesotensis 3608]
MKYTVVTVALLGLAYGSPEYQAMSDFQQISTAEWANAATQLGGDFDALTEAIKPILKNAKCALPCLVGAINTAKCHGRGEPIVKAACDSSNRAQVTRQIDSCLESHCHLGGIARKSTKVRRIRA